MDQHDGSVPHSGNDSTTTSTSNSSGDSIVPSIDNSVPLSVTRIATIGYATSTGDWIDEEKLARPLKDTATEISLCIDARKEKVKNDFLQKQENLTDEDKQFIRDTKDRKKRQGKKALWALTWWDDQKRKTLPELWQKAKESNITHNLSDVKLVIRRNVLNSLANMLYTKENEQKQQHQQHHHKFEHPQEYCVEKRDGALFLDVIRSNYELREWRFGRDILGKAMESAFIDNTDIELYNTLIIQGKGEFQVGITADFGYTDIDGSPCELAPISSDRVDDEKRILNSWIRAKLGGIAKVTKVVYDRAPGKPISISDTVTEDADALETPTSFPGFDLLFDTLLELINLANSLPDGIYYTLYRSDSGFAAFTPTRREEIRKRVYTHPPRGGYYGGGRGGGFHRPDHHNNRGGRPPMHHQHHHHHQQPHQGQLYYQPAAFQQEPSVYIRNLPFDIVREELIEFFSLNNCKVKEIHFHHDSATGRLKGSAIVDFFDFESFSLALGLSGQQVKGRSIEVRIARKPSSSSISSGDSRAERDEHWERGKRSDRGGSSSGDGSQYPPAAGSVGGGYPHHSAHYRGGPPRGYTPYVHGIVPVGYFPSYDRSFRGRGRGGSYYGGGNGGAGSGSAPGGRGGATNWNPNHRNRGHQQHHHHQHHQQHHQQAVQEQHKQEEQQQQF